MKKLFERFFGQSAEDKLLARLRSEDEWEAEGGAAGLQGKTRDDCPYSETTQSDAWNYWVYGCENASGELATLASGEVFFTDSDPPGKDWCKPGTGVPVRDAIESGLWKPRYARL